MIILNIRRFLKKKEILQLQYSLKKSTFRFPNSKFGNELSTQLSFCRRCEFRSRGGISDRIDPLGDSDSPENDREYIIFENKEEFFSFLEKPERFCKRFREMEITTRISIENLSFVKRVVEIQQLFMMKQYRSIDMDKRLDKDQKFRELQRLKEMIENDISDSICVEKDLKTQLKVVQAESHESLRVVDPEGFDKTRTKELGIKLLIKYHSLKIEALEWLLRTIFKEPI